MRPEDYWINLGENIIGLDAIADGEKARQYRTYKAIVDIVLGRGIRDVLDVGCNYAPLGILLRQSGYEGFYLGLETNGWAFLRAQCWYDVSPGDLRNIHYKDQTWPCVVVKDVIEHLESVQPLREAFRVSQRYVIIATYLPWHDAPSIIIQHPDGYYTNTYNRAEIVALAKDCGFGLIEDVQVLESNGTPNEVTLWERE